MDKDRKPDLYIGKQPWYIGFYGENKKTNDIKENLHPKDVPDISRFDGFAEALGYSRYTD